MIYFLKHFKGIAYFLIMLILFQSCTVYKKKPSTIEEASSEKKTHIKILTKDGHEHKFRWIEEKDGNAYTVTNAKRVFVNKNKIERYVVLLPYAAPVPLDFAVEHKGIVYIDTQKDATYDPTVKDTNTRLLILKTEGALSEG
jgi:ABC-type Fe3+-hydroxamate transport system substrate-binding protein